MDFIAPGAVERIRMVGRSVAIANRPPEAMPTANPSQIRF